MSDNKEIEVIKKETKNIMNQIMDINDHVSDSFYLIEAVATQKTGIWDKISGKNTTDKITNLAYAMGSTNVAVMQLSQVVQKAMALSCRSMVHAQTMTKTIGKMLEKGLEDTHGEIRQLSGQDREIAEQILRSAQTFTENQEAIEAEFINTSKKVNGLEVDINSLKEESNKFVRQDVFGELHEVVSQQQNKFDDLKVAYERQLDESKKKTHQKMEELEGQIKIINTNHGNFQQDIEVAINSLREESNKFVRQEVFGKLDDTVSQQQNQIKDLKVNYERQLDESEKKTHQKMEELEGQIEIIHNNHDNFRQDYEAAINSLREESNKFVRQSDLVRICEKEIEKYQAAASEKISIFTTQQIDKVRNSIELDCESIKSNLESIVTDAGKNLRQETEKLLQQQQEELEELKSQLEAKRKPHPLSIVTLIVSIAALLVAIITFCTGNSATDIEAPTSTTMEIETTTEVPAAQQ